jgi:hypothetical protein
MSNYKRVKGAGGQKAPIIVSAPDMTQLWTNLNDTLLWATEDELSYYSSLDFMFGDVLATADSAEFKLDIGHDVWITPSRWNTLTRQYCDPDRLFLWLERIKEVSTYSRGVIAMDFNTVKHQVVQSNKRASRRKGGACMRMIVYRAFPQPTISLYSRTSYLGYIGALDMLLAHKLTELAADMIGDGLRVSDFQFRWHLDVAQFHSFKSMAYIFMSNQDAFMKVPEQKWPTGRKYRGRTILPLERYPGWQSVRYWYKRIAKQDKDGKLYSEMKYGAEKRIRRRFHAATGVDQTQYLNGEREYPPLTTPIELITLDRMLYKTPESRAVIRKQKLEKAEKLIHTLFDDDEADILMLDQL